MSDQSISVAVAGSTARTVMCASALLNDPRFNLEWALTPAPKPIGRKQEISPNPLHLWAKSNGVDSILIEDKINSKIKEEILKSSKINILLVVDFGYIVPEWLLEVPTVAPLNIHPSLLPRWRGSSPGQFVLLYGEKQSGVSLIVMNSELDQGDIVTQLPFSVDPNWTQSEYYQYSFQLIATQLADVIVDLVDKKISTHPQPVTSPTVIAGRLSRQDGFIEWPVIVQALQGETPSHLGVSAVVKGAASQHPSAAALIVAACKAFYPWPGIWTIINTDKGSLRMKILGCEVDSKNENRLLLKTVQLEGKPPSSWEATEKILK